MLRRPRLTFVVDLTSGERQSACRAGRSGCRQGGIAHPPVRGHRSVFGNPVDHDDAATAAVYLKREREAAIVAERGAKARTKRGMEDDPGKRLPRPDDVGGEGCALFRTRRLKFKGIERLGIPSIMLTDGTHGLRKQTVSGERVDLNASVPTTCFPTAAALAATWNRDLVYRVGEALAQECLAEKVAILLGPGANIKRSPLCGRNFEYFSEDPYLTGEMAKAHIRACKARASGPRSSTTRPTIRNAGACRSTRSSTNGRCARSI